MQEQRWGGGYKWYQPVLYWRITALPDLVYWWCPWSPIKGFNFWEEQRLSYCGVLLLSLQNYEKSALAPLTLKDILVVCRVCAKRLWLRVVFWGLFFPLLLGVRHLSLRFGVQVLMQPFCLGMLQIEHLDCKLNNKKWLNCKTKEVAQWQIYNEMFWWINAL